MAYENELTAELFSIDFSSEGVQDIVPVNTMRALPWVVVFFSISGCLGRRPSERETFDLSAPREEDRNVPSTFSIVAFDPQNGDLGVAVESKFFAVGAVVPWVEAGIGAVATQSYANTTYGPRALQLLSQGLSPEEAARKLTEADPERDFRQLGIVDAQGRSFSYTGKRCVEWAGSRSGENFCVQGNLLVSQATIDAMAKTFVESKGEIADRLALALQAGQAAGGDGRGRQSAALVVLRKNGGYAGFNDRYVDLRVDDHPDPISELCRLTQLQLGKDALIRAHRLEHQGHNEEAIKLLRGALAEDPGWDAIQFELARLLLSSGKGDQGKSELAQAIGRSPEYDHYRYRAAEILAGAGLEEEAMAELRKTLSINREYAHVFRRELENPVSAFRSLRDKIERILKERGEKEEKEEKGEKFRQN